MINIYLLVLLSIAVIASIIRASLLKSIYIGIMSSIFSVLLTALVSYVSLYQAFIYLNDYLPLKILFIGIIIMGVIFSLIGKERKLIISIATSNTFFIFVVCVLPFLVAFNTSKIANRNFLEYGINYKNIIGIIVLYLISVGALILNYFLGSNAGTNRANVYVKDISYLKNSKNESEKKRYTNYQKYLYSVENTFYPINYYSLFIVSVIVVGLASISFDKNYSVEPVKSIFYNDYENTVLYGQPYSAYDTYNNLVVHYERDDDAVGQRIYDTCVVDLTTEIETCIDTRGYTRDYLLTDTGLYFKSKNELYYYESNTLSRVFDYDEELLLDDFYLYIDNQKVYLESDIYKWELDRNTVVSVTDFTPLNDLGQVRITQGHVLIRTAESKTIIDGIEYDISVSLEFIQFFESVITNGEYQFQDGEVLPFGKEPSRLYLIDGEYYSGIGYSNYEFFVNTRDEYDVIRFEDRYHYGISYETGDDGTTNKLGYVYANDLGIRLNLQAQYPFVTFSVLWTVILYIVSSRLYFVLKKE